MKTTLFASSSALALCLACGDAQTDTEYRGEALLTLEGSVLDVTADTRGTEPTILFTSVADTEEEVGDTIFSQTSVAMMPVQVDGEFPSKFTLRLFQPPPREMMYLVPPEESDDPTRPLSMAIGQVAAVHPGYPTGVIRSEIEATAHEDGSSESKAKVCNPDGRCHVITSRCDAELECSQDRSPDAPKRVGWEWFAGLSDVVVIYLSRDLNLNTPAGRFLAAEIGVSTRGYHTLVTYRFSKKELADAEACELEADANVRATYEREHGRAFDYGEASDAEAEAFDEALDAEEERLSCLDTDRVMEAPKGEPITVRMFESEQS